MATDQLYRLVGRFGLIQQFLELLGPARKDAFVVVD